MRYFLVMLFVNVSCASKYEIQEFSSDVFNAKEGVSIELKQEHK